MEIVDFLKAETKLEIRVSNFVYYFTLVFALLVILGLSGLIFYYGGLWGVTKQCSEVIANCSQPIVIDYSDAMDPDGYIMRTGGGNV